MTNFIFANNCNTTLAGDITAGATTLTLTSATNFPSSIPAGYVMALTLNDAATRQLFEIVYITALSGVNLTVQRAQEGTTALAWAAGSFIFSGPTAGQMQALKPGLLLAAQTFFANGTYTPTPGTTVSYQHAYGAGGGAAGSPATSSVQVSAAGGGGSGAYTWKKVVNPTTQAVVVGVGGSGGTGANGQSGGASSIGSYLSAGGGGGGLTAGPTGTAQSFIANGGAGGSVLVAGDFGVAGMPGNFQNVIAATDTAQGIDLRGTPGMFMRGYGYGGAPNANPRSAAAVTGESGQNGFVICYDYS